MNEIPDGINKMPEIKVGPATTEDVRGAIEVVYKSWVATFPNEKAGITKEDIEKHMGRTLTEESLKRMEHSFAHPSENMKRFVAKENGKVIGYCVVKHHGQEEELAVLHMLPGQKGKGIGSRLWGYAQKELDSSKDVFLTVADYNSDAIEFYKKRGFVDTGERIVEKPINVETGAHRTMMKMILKARPVSST